MTDAEQRLWNQLRTEQIDGRRALMRAPALRPVVALLVLLTFVLEEGASVRSIYKPKPCRRPNR